MSDNISISILYHLKRNPISTPVHHHHPSKIAQELLDKGYIDSHTSESNGTTYTITTEGRLVLDQVEAMEML